MFSKNLFTPKNNRFIFCLIILASFGSVAFALFSQYHDLVEPCPLCIAQRVIYFLIGLVAIFAFFHKSLSFPSKVYALILLAIAAFGAKVAYHHVWLQSLPPEQWPASCGMPLSVLYKQIPLTGFIHTILSGTAECAMINWKVFGISGPFLSLCNFILIALLALYPLIVKNK